MITQQEFCYCRETFSPTRAAFLRRYIPFSLSCKTFYSAWKERLNAPQDCPVSPRVVRPIQLFCAIEQPLDDAINLGFELETYQNNLGFI